MHTLPVNTQRVTESADGRAHLSYFEDRMSFVWTGDPETAIEVSPGASGEPVAFLVTVDQFDLTEAGCDASVDHGTTPGTLAHAAATFERLCDRWLAEYAAEVAS